MIGSTLKTYSAVALSLAITCSWAQTPSTGTAVRFDKDKGVVIQKDSTFKLTFRFRMQNRFALLSESGDDLSVGATDIRIRRMRLRFDGYVLSPKVQYKVQLGFSKGDLDLIETNTAQPIRDAIGYYVPNAHWAIGIGQTKLPGNRQRVVSSGALQLPDRSIVNGGFTLDRDFGLFATWRTQAGDQHVAVKGAVSTGEGRNASPGDDGLCYTGRVEWLPLGEFQDDGDYFEGDIAWEAKPKLAFGGVYSTNVNARRSGGQLGEFFPTGQGRTMNTCMADALLKYRGTAWTTEFCQREVDGDPVVAGDEEVVTALEGWGLNTQLSRMIGQKNELVGRYSIIVPTEEASRGGQHRREESWVGFTHYINHHRVKLQSAVQYSWRDGVADLDAAGNRWGLWFQLELGI